MTTSHRLAARRAAAALLCTIAGAAPLGAQGAADSSVGRWITAHARPLRTVTMSDSLDDLRPFAAVVGPARVVAFGEQTHGAHEPLAFRNRLFRYLVEELGFTAIAVETGLPESRAVAGYVAGDSGAPAPGDAGRIVQRGFTWGFGNFAENVELVRWMRDYNDDPRHRRKVTFYGIDLSLGGPLGSTPTPAAIDGALQYLARVDSGAASQLRARFAPVMRHLPGDPSVPITAAAHDTLTSAIDALVGLLERRHTPYVAASSERDYAWAMRDAVVARQSDRVHRVEVPALPGGGIPAGAWRVVSARDSAMAANVAWALEREGPRGRVLVFAHDMHVKNAATVGGAWPFDRPPTAMGQILRGALGDRLVIVGGVGGARPRAASRDEPSLDATLARRGIPRFVLDLRGDADSAVRAWRSGVQSLRVNGDAVIVLQPSVAFDAFVYLDSLTPARRNAP
jgi:erythromycin esterase